ncbi:oligosaccharide flippase family protein [Clostridium sp. NSJ-49]|uniref:oligosaccharide flippase family protein n=1 Tax=Clostridium TaxID=1485 RepID=UPI00164C577B|nr:MULTISPECIES: oligosaccharide flippase family protein [unclassified Clostridium]MBC5626234.1 oligosaccharide flippase family protein [Clostridium sp. NSJ-49]MCD2502000.1 oligosaccharide flippase family protein [Clostridium sp. NSJ-145]MDU6341330.1 oligosaccharide flippase family protein [Clostridium sp.]
MNKKAENLFVNTIILTITALIMRVIGIIYKVYISNEVGTEGMGLYKLIGTVSSVAITIAVSGISTGVTRIVSEEVSRKNYSNIKAIVFKACAICGGLSIVASVVLFLFSENIALLFLKDERVVISLKIVAISIPFISISSCIKGYFFAVRDIFIPITSQFAEQFIKITVVVGLLSLVMPRGLEYGCAVLVLGTAISDIFSCIYVFISYKLEKKENKNFNVIKEKSGDLLKRLFNIALPVAGSSYIMSAFRSVEMILIPASLVKFGMSTKEAVSVLGGVMGMVFPIISFPAVLLMSLGRVLIPEISRAKAINNNERVNSLISRSIGFTCIIGIMSFFIFSNFYNELSISIYNRDDLGIFFKMISIAIPFMYIDMIVGGILNGLNQQVKSLEYQILESVLKIVLIYTIVPLKGVSGLIITMLITTVFSFILSFLRVIKVTNLKINFNNWIIKPLIFSFVSIIIGRVINGVLSEYNLAIGVVTAMVLFVVLMIYLFLLKLFNCIKFRD